MTRLLRGYVLRTVGTIALAVSSAACASTGAIPRPFPSPAGTPPVASPVSEGTPDGSAVAGSALALRGTPYLNGGSDPAGFDCSGFTQYVFGEYGVALPRGVREQYQIGRPIDAGALAPGDLIFFSTTGPGASHVGIAVGGDQFVHAPSSNGVVRVERLSAPYWSKRFIGARRIS